MTVFPFERSGDLMSITARVSSFVVQALALGDEYGVDGLLGMNFLERFNFTVRPVEQEIHLEPV